MGKDVLAARAALDGSELPFEVAGCRLVAAPERSLVAVAPMAGRAGAVADALGLKLETGRTGKAHWMGKGLWLLPGADWADIAARLGDMAMVAPQSDSWAVFDIMGPAARDVMARLCPLDTEPGIFGPGETARTEFAHLMASVTPLEEGGFRVMVMRSFGADAVHHTKDAMRSVAAQRR